MLHRWLKRLFLAAVLVSLLAWGYDRAQIIVWVGGTDLTVEFVVTDAQSGEPIPSARIEVKSEGGFYRDRHEKDFVLTAGDNGVASKECLDNTCVGRQSGLRFTDTFAVYLPDWYFRVVAEGHEPSQWVELHRPEYSSLAKRAEPGKSRVVVPVRLNLNRD